MMVDTSILSEQKKRGRKFPQKYFVEQFRGEHFVSYFMKEWQNIKFPSF
jgi:hypothetical protein